MAPGPGYNVSSVLAMPLALLLSVEQHIYVHNIILILLIYLTHNSVFLSDKFKLSVVCPSR